MPQAPLFLPLTNPATGSASLSSSDANGIALLAKGWQSALNLTTAKVVQVGAGRLVKISVISGGSTSGSFVLNDAATTGAAATANQIFVIAQGATAGTLYDLDFPFANGLVLSAVPSAGSPQIALVFS